MLRATFGLLESRDHGATFGWVCPSALGYDGDKEDPALAFTSQGALAVGVFDGLTVAPDGACGFAFAEGELAGRSFIDVASSGADVVALSSNGVAADTFDVRLWRAGADGATFEAFGAPLPSDFLALSVELGPPKSRRILLSGRDGTSSGAMGTPSYAGVLFRSDDDGATWQRLALAGIDGVDEAALLGAISPADPERVYLRTQKKTDTERRDRLLVSDDGGATFAESFARDFALSSFALSPDGGAVAIGGEKAGIWLASAAALDFALASSLHVGCLAFGPAELYACTHEYIDGHALAVSRDQGATFEPLFSFASLCSAAECASDTRVGEVCPSLWPVEAGELSVKATCALPPPPPPPPIESCDCHGARGVGRPPAGSAGSGPLLGRAGSAPILALLVLAGVARRRRVA